MAPERQVGAGAPSWCPRRSRGADVKQKCSRKLALYRAFLDSVIFKLQSSVLSSGSFRRPYLAAVCIRKCSVKWLPSFDCDSRVVSGRSGRLRRLPIGIPERIRKYSRKPVNNEQDDAHRNQLPHRVFGVCCRFPGTMYWKKRKKKVHTYIWRENTNCYTALL